MPPATGHRRLAAIMFTDMVGYSALSQRNEALALDLLEEHRRLVRDILPRHGGREVKTTGDGFLIEFPSALAAVQCAVAIQQALHERNQVHPGERRVHIRIGIHVGDVVHHDGDIHGDGVNIAARIEPLAEPGGICVSNAVFEQVRNKVEHPLTALGHAGLKNIETPMVVHRVGLPWLRREGLLTEAAPGGVVTRRRPAARVMGLIGLVLISTLGVWLAVLRGESRPPENKTIAVLPLLSQSTNTADQAWALSVTYLLTSELKKIEAFEVRPLTLEKSYLDPGRNAVALGRQQKADFVVDGTVERSGGQIRLVPRLIHVQKGETLWENPHQRPADDLFGLQKELATDIASQIRVKLTPADKARLARKPTENPEALDAFTLGWVNWLREDAVGITNAWHYFTLATQKDPNYAEAWAGLASVYTLASGVGIPFTNGATAWKAPALKALALDPNLPLTHVALGMGYLIMERDWHQAEVHLKRALELDPKYALAYNAYGNFLYGRGRLEAAITNGLKAVELEPRVMFWRADVTWFYNAAGRYPEALSTANAALALEPRSGLVHAQKAWTYLFMGRTQEAVVLFHQAVEFEPRNPNFAWGLGCGLAAAGQREAAQRVLVQLEELRQRVPVSRFFTAGIQLALGNREAALDQLELGARENDPCLWWLGGDPTLAQLRNEPRFQAILKGIAKP